MPLPLLVRRAKDSAPRLGVGVRSITSRPEVDLLNSSQTSPSGHQPICPASGATTALTIYRSARPTICCAAAEDGVGPEYHCEGDWAFWPLLYNTRGHPTRLETGILVSGALPCWGESFQRSGYYARASRAKEWAEGSSPDDRIRN